MTDIEERPTHMTKDEYIAQQMRLLGHIHEEYTEQYSAHNASLQGDNAMHDNGNSTQHTDKTGEQCCGQGHRVHNPDTGQRWQYTNQNTATQASDTILR